MRVYTAHMRRSADARANDLRLIKEGFSWPAFLFTVLWAVWCRLWGVAVALVLLEIVLALGLAWLDSGPITETIAMVAVSLLLGLYGNDLKRWYARRQGYLPVAVVTAPDADAATQRLFDREPNLAASLAG